MLIITLTIAAIAITQLVKAKECVAAESDLDPDGFYNTVYGGEYTKIESLDF